MAEGVAESLKLIYQRLEKLDNLEILINKTLQRVEAVQTEVNNLRLRLKAWNTSLALLTRLSVNYKQAPILIQISTTT